MRQARRLSYENELALAPKQSAGCRSHNGGGGLLWLYCSAVAGGVGGAVAECFSRAGGRGAGTAAISGHELLAGFVGRDGRVAVVAAAEHFFARRHGLDFKPDDLAHHRAGSGERLASAWPLRKLVCLCKWR